MMVYTLIWSECYGESAFLGVYNNKEDVEKAIHNNLEFRDLDDSEEKQEIIDEEYFIFKSAVNKREEEKI
ncbi:hypothetical protein KJJ36_14220 [Staphylococcus pseudoxylosus]|uniref:hypothetical protein n=1 Tax=Staphylococcus pseudoxylosus TaxID=2282419 RepID=UPI001F3E8C1C|nr:hypothetical protein [Staphylococcus pseudoxylosus]MCE5003524.1 hypothetical protein [Staphylococcus pseudoxylosus]